MRGLLTLTLIIGILAAVLGGILVIIELEEEPERPTEQFINMVMQPQHEVSATLNGPDSVYSQMYSLHMQKVERNQEMNDFREGLEQEERDYKQRRENWVRYIDGELIRGYDPRYDRIFDINDLYVKED